jgi:restriction system protein
MTIPTYDQLIFPVLKYASEKPWAMKDLTTRIADDLQLSPEDRAKQISNGAPLISSRVHWAKTYLKQAGLLDQPKRGVITIGDL